MPTERWYLTRRAASFTPSSYLGDWADTSAVTSTTRMTLHKEGGGDYRSGFPGLNQNAAIWRFVSEPLGRNRQFFGFHLASLGIGTESSGHSDTFTHIKAWITTGNTSTPRGILIPDQDLGPQWSTSAIEGRVYTDIACEGPSGFIGDRIVVELGVRNHAGNIYAGSENTDFVEHGPAFPAGSQQAAWLEFYQDVQFGVPTPIGARYAKVDGITTSTSGYYQVPIGTGFTSTVYVLLATNHGSTVSPLAVTLGGISGVKLFDQDTVYLRHTVWRIDGVPPGPALLTTTTSGICTHNVVAYTIAYPPTVGTETFFADGALSGAVVSLTASSTIGSLMIDHVINNENGPMTYTPGAGQAFDVDYRTNDTFHEASSTKIATSGTSNMSWTFSVGDEPWSILGLGLKPSGAVEPCRDDGRAWWFDNFDNRVTLSPHYGVTGTVNLDLTGGTFGSPGVGGLGELSRLVTPDSQAFSVSFKHKWGS